jgi:hypothetical protein
MVVREHRIVEQHVASFQRLPGFQIKNPEPVSVSKIGQEERCPSFRVEFKSVRLGYFVPDQTAERVNVSQRNGVNSKDGVGGYEARRSRNGDRVERVKDVTEGVDPERFRKLGAQKLTAYQVSNSPVSSLGDPVKLRGVRGTHLMLNTVFKKERLKSL